MRRVGGGVTVWGGKEVKCPLRCSFPSGDVQCLRMSVDILGTS